MNDLIKWLIESKLAKEKEIKHVKSEMCDKIIVNTKKKQFAVWLFNDGYYHLFLDGCVSDGHMIAKDLNLGRVKDYIERYLGGKDVNW